MKRIFFVALTFFLLTGCTNNHKDEDALSNIVNGLNERWDYSDGLDGDPDIEDFKKSIQLELDNLDELNIDQFKDVKLYGLYDDYRKEVNNGLTIAERYDDAEDLYRDWFIHSEERGVLLKSLYNNYSLDIPEDQMDTFEKIINFKSSDLGEGFDSKVSESQIIYYMEEMTGRHMNSSQLANGSFEQKSELNACLKRVDSISDELLEKFGEHDGFVIKMIELGKETKKACQDKLDGHHDKDYDNALITGQLLGDISRLYAKGDLPPTTIKVTGKMKAN